MRLLSLILFSLLDIIPAGKSFLRPEHGRDSILVGDRVEYGFRMDNIAPGTELLFPDFGNAGSDTLVITRTWKADTLNRDRRGRVNTSKPGPVEFSMEMAFFEEGVFKLPPIPVGRVAGGRVDTLIFEACEVEIKQIPIDTNTFVIRDIKEQMTYPVTVAEVLPKVGIGLLVLALIAGVVFLLNMRRRRKAAENAPADPPHIVALRKLDRFRGEKYWAKEKQKMFYSGITDALKEYIDGRFSIDAPEMTTDELFAALKACQDITPEMYGKLKELFETADYVKFAKFYADDTMNASALPLAVQFVTTTYRNADEEAAPEGK